MPDTLDHSSSLAGIASSDRGVSPLDGLDPRVRIVVAVAFAMVVAVANRFDVLLLALGMAMIGLAISRLGPWTVFKRLIPLNAFMLLLFVLVPPFTGEAALWSLGPVSYGEEGAVLAARITLKGNAIVLTMVVLLGRMSIVTMGHALAHLRVPNKLVHLLLFTVRYFDVLRREYSRLVAAMKMRGFRPKMNWHTYRTYGHLMGMLLVRGLERSERIVAAMKCRGFRGRFYLLDHFAFSAADVWFGAAAAALILAALAILEYS
jgi:cobalt/nickel transport system permease protein